MGNLRKLPIESGDYHDYADFMGAWCRLCQYQVIVEIGVYLGETTLRLCEAAKATGGKVFGYDRFEPIGEPLNWTDPTFGKEGVEAKLIAAGYDGLFKITKIDTKQNDFADILRRDGGGKVDFAFIDGDHSYDGIKNDFLKVYPLLVEDGSIMFHDTYNHPGCRKFVLDLYDMYHDGKYDIINLPFGFGHYRCGLTILSKRSFPMFQEGLSNPHEDDTPFITKEEVYNAEEEWYSKRLINKT